MSYFYFVCLFNAIIIFIYHFCFFIIFVEPKVGPKFGPNSNLFRAHEQFRPLFNPWSRPKTQILKVHLSFNKSNGRPRQANQGLFGVCPSNGPPSTCPLACFIMHHVALQCFVFMHNELQDNPSRLISMHSRPLPQHPTISAGPSKLSFLPWLLPYT